MQLVCSDRNRLVVVIAEIMSKGGKIEAVVDIELVPDEVDCVQEFTCRNRLNVRISIAFPPSNSRIWNDIIHCEERNRH